MDLKRYKSLIETRALLMLAFNAVHQAWENMQLEDWKDAEEYHSLHDMLARTENEIYESFCVLDTEVGKAEE